MRHRTERHQDAADRTLKDIRRKTRKRYSSEEKVRIVLPGCGARTASPSCVAVTQDRRSLDEAVSLCATQSRATAGYGVADLAGGNNAASR